VKKASTTPTNIDEYIAASPAAVRPILKEIRRIARAAAPDAEEVISYRMPAFRLRGILIYFAAFKHHIGLFPPVSGDANLEKALAPYAGPKGNLRFPLGQAIPYGLVQRIVQLRVKQDSSKVVAKTTSRVPTRKVSPSKTLQRKRKRVPLTARA
jgi:uncharacterized protein YdhG (YjbR/CyaY superfamily)